MRAHLRSSIVLKGQVTFSVHYGNPARGHCMEVLFGEWMEGQPHSAASTRSCFKDVSLGSVL